MAVISPEAYRRRINQAATSRAAAPADAALLQAEISAADTARLRGLAGGFHPGGLTPEALGLLLREAETGDADGYLDLAEAMEEKDLHYLGVLSKRKRQVVQLPITVEAAGDGAADQKAADFIREWASRDILEAELFDVLDAIGKGYSASEIIWNRDGRLWFPEKLKWRHPRWFAFHRADGETPLLKGGFEGADARDGHSQGVPLPPGKFLFHLHPAKSGLPVRGGLARAVAWAWLFKNYAVKDWLAFAEIYGRPFRIGRYPAGATEDQIATLLRAVAGMGEDAAAVIPESMAIELVDGKAGGGDLYERMAAFLDRQISKAVLGETATTDADVGGLGSGREHGDVRADIERADARLLGASLTRDIATPMVRLNFGPDAGVPKIRLGRAEEWDAGQMMPAVRTFVELGGRVEMSVIADRLGLPDAPKGEGAELLRWPDAADGETGRAEISPVQRRKGASGLQIPETASTRFLMASYPPYSLCPPATGDARMRGGPENGLRAAIMAGIAAAMAAHLPPAGTGEPAAEDEIAALLAEEWEEILTPVADPLLAAAGGAASYEEALAAITATLAATDTAALENAVARGSLLARAETAAARSAANEALAAHSDDTRAKLADVARRRQREKGRFAEEGIGPRGLRRLAVQDGREHVEIARLTDESARLLEVRSPSLRLSAATLRKQIRKHPEVLLTDYRYVSTMVNHGELRLEQGGVFQAIDWRDGDPWYAVVKRTRDGESAFLVSYRRTSAEDLERKMAVSQRLRKAK